MLQDKRVVLDGTIPVAGRFYKGDMVRYVPVAGSFMGAVCTTAGEPGTWKTFGAISA
jgi:hypothetical protein